MPAPGTLFRQQSADRRGVLGTLILAAVWHGDLRCVKRGGGVVLRLVVGAARQAGSGLFDLCRRRDAGAGAGGCGIIRQRVRQPRRSAVIIACVPCRLLRVDGRGDAVDKGGRIRRGGCLLVQVLGVAAVGGLRRGRVQPLGKAGVGRRGGLTARVGRTAGRRCGGHINALRKAAVRRGGRGRPGGTVLSIAGMLRGRRRQVDVPGQRVDQRVHVVPLAGHGHWPVPSCFAQEDSSTAADSS